MICEIAYYRQIPGTSSRFTGRDSPPNASAYRQFRQNPRHPGLHFKRMEGSKRLMSVRVNRDYRAAGVRVTPSEIVWFWIGGHDEYNKLLENRKS